MTLIHFPKQRTVPELPVKDADGCFKVWCIYCGCHHSHGRIYGHRVAHCPPYSESPYLATGYRLVPPDEGEQC